MRLNTLTPAKGSVKNNKRVGRGQGSGRGGTSTRGHKGAKSRSGYSRKSGFEGGQMPLQRRVPKFGFTNHNRVQYKAINLSDLQKLSEAGVSEISPEVLVQKGLAGKKERIKILAKGTFSAKLNVTAHAFSATAAKMIEEAGGKVTTL